MTPLNSNFFPGTGYGQGNSGGLLSTSAESVLVYECTRNQLKKNS